MDIVVKKAIEYMINRRIFSIISSFLVSFCLKKYAVCVYVAHGIDGMLKRIQHPLPPKTQENEKNYFRVLSTWLRILLNGKNF